MGFIRLPNQIGARNEYFVDLHFGYYIEFTANDFKNPQKLLDFDQKVILENLAR